MGIANRVARATSQRGIISVMIAFGFIACIACDMIANEVAQIASRRRIISMMIVIGLGFR
jgi:hypothetical protein